MKDNTAISPLAAPNEKSGKIRFIHEDGTERSFFSCVNRLSGSRISGFDKQPPTVDDSLAWVKSVFRDIRAKAVVIECVGDF